MEPTRFLRSVRFSACLLAFGVAAAPAGAETVVVTPHPTDPLLSGVYLQSRLASITNASEFRRYLLKLEAGVYDLKYGTLEMKPYVDVEGSGQGVTLLRSRAAWPGTVRAASKSALRSLTVANTAPDTAVALQGATGFSATDVTCVAVSSNDGTAIAVEHAADGNSALQSVTAEATGAPAYGVRTSAGVLRDVVVRATSDKDAYGVFTYSSLGNVELVNLVSEAQGGRLAVGLRTEGREPMLRGGRISARGGQTAVGIESFNDQLSVFGATVRVYADSQAVGVRGVAGATLLSHVEVLAEGGETAAVLGVESQAHGAMQIRAGSVRAVGSSAYVYGLLTQDDTVTTVEGTALAGARFSAFAAGSPSSAPTILLGASRLEGPVDAGLGKILCVASYDGAFKPLDEACSPAP